MGYRLLPEVDTGPHRTILARSRALWNAVAAVFLTLGVAMGLVGALALAGGDEPEDTDTTAYILLGFGLVFAPAGGLVGFGMRSPDLLVFDNRAAQLLIKEDRRAPDAECPGVPYSELEGMGVRRRVSSNSSNRGNSVRWDVVLHKHDGVPWVLASTGSQERSGSLLADLERRVTLGGGDEAPDRLARPPATSGTFTVEHTDDATFIRWRKPAGLGRALTAAVILAGFACAIVGFRPQMPGFVFALVSGFLGLIAALLTWSVVTSVNKRGRVEVTSSELIVGEEGGVWRRGFVAPLFEVAAIAFAFDPAKQDDTILVLSAAERDRMADATRGEGPQSLSEGFAMATAMTRTRRILPGRLSIAEKLELELLLQRAIRERSGREIT